jgi:hypothetical protein
MLVVAFNQFGVWRRGMGVNSKKGMMNILNIMSDQHSPHVLGCYGDSIVEPRTWTG